MHDVIIDVKEQAVASLRADADLTSVVGDRVHAVSSPPGTATPRITITSPSEDAGNATTFKRPSYSTSLTFDIWVEEDGDALTLLVYRYIKNVLHNTKLPIPGGGYLTGKVRLVTVFKDPDNITTHGVARLESVARK